MQIIKVVHGNYVNSTSYELEKQQFTLQTYDIDTFIKNITPIILIKKQPALYLAKVVTTLTFIANPIKVINAAKDKELIEKDKDVMGNVISNVIKYTADELFKDILTAVNIPNIITLEEAKNKYSRTNNLSVGTYTFHPYDSERLTRLEHFHKNLALEKDDELIVLLGKMGAKSVRIMESNAEAKDFIGSAKGSKKTESILYGAQGDIKSSIDMENSSELLV